MPLATIANKKDTSPTIAPMPTNQRFLHYEELESAPFMQKWMKKRENPNTICIWKRNYRDHPTSTNLLTQLHIHGYIAQNDKTRHSWQLFNPSTLRLWRDRLFPTIRKYVKQYQLQTTRLNRTISIYNIDGLGNTDRLITHKCEINV